MIVDWSRQSVAEGHCGMWVDYVEHGTKQPLDSKFEL